MSGRGRNALYLCASVLVIGLLFFARSVFAPVALSLFAVAVVWPVQRWLEARLPQLVALAISLSLTVLALSALLALSVWGIGQVGHWMIVNATHLQDFYTQLTQCSKVTASSSSVSSLIGSTSPGSCGRRKA